jgi:hypothetical protein
MKVWFLSMMVGYSLFCIVFSSCGGTPTPVQSLAPAQVAVPAPASAPQAELDAAIRETSDYFNRQLPGGNKLVILNIQSEFPALLEYIIDELIANTVNDKVFTVVDRQQLNAIRAELVFQMSGEVDDATAQALGRMAGAQTIISGAVTRIGDLYRLRVRALNVQSAQIEGQFNRNIPDSPMIAALVRSRATDYGSGVSQPAASDRETVASGGRIGTSAPAPVEDPNDLEMLRGIWTDYRSGLVMTFIDNYAFYTQVRRGRENSAYYEALNRGIIKIGDKGFRNITKVADMSWSYEAMGPDGIWHNGVSYMNADGQTLNLANGYTYNKGGW